jgi:SAM-dependent methyltransferase
MLFPFAEAGHDCVGVEPSGVFGEYVRGRGLTVYDSLDQLQRVNPKPQFDVILHFFVVEHIAELLEFFKVQLSLLKPGGKIIFEIPNAADPLYSVYDIPAFERFYWSVAHPWYFSEKSLHYLLNQLGRPYEIVRDQRYDLSNHMVWARDGRPGGMGRFTEALGSELEESYKQALIRSGKCDTLIGIIRQE